ncbi:MAG: NUDIX hydrolase [Fulvivirga sp.]|nr:NUDIX hydrolase [Fulvivirga sp.]
MEKVKNPWKKLSSEVKYDNPWILVEEHDVINPGGGESIYGKVHFKNKAIGIIPLDKDNNTWIVGQYRYTLDDYSWEIPEGGGPLHEDLLEAAQRELKEETGLTAKNWEIIMKLHNSNSVTDEEAFIFLARDLTEGKARPEETEFGLKVKKLPFDEVLEMVMNGKITDSMSVAGMLKVARMLEK